MKDPRLIEIEFLAILERERPNQLDPPALAKRLGTTTEIFEAMTFSLFEAGCLNGTPFMDPPDKSGRGYAGFDPSDLSTWSRYSNVESARRLLNHQPTMAFINHAGRLRLWRLRDEIHASRTRDAFNLLWDKRHWTPDLTTHMALTDAGDQTTILFIDVDDFKSVNEQASHLVGDRVLQMIFRAVLAEVGELGDAYRWGGDEVTVLLPRAGLAIGNRIGDAIQATVAREAAQLEDLAARGLTTTVSVGVGAFTGSPSPDLVTEQVAALMKRVKANGKNSVLAEDLGAS